MMRRTLVGLATLALAVGATAVPPALAQPASGGEVRMTLGEALETALRNNLDLVAARKDPAIAKYNVTFEASVFDPTLGASVRHREVKSEPSSVFVSDRIKTDTADVSWVDRLRFGGEYSVTLQTFREDAPNQFRSYNPAYSSSLSFNFRMPLLNGLGVETNTQGLIVAQRNLEISHETLRQQAHATMIEVESAYWNLLATLAARDVARSSMKLAQDLYDLNKKRVEVGTLAPIEITQAEAGVASREEGVIVAETALLNAEDNLRRLLSIPPGDPMWSKRILPTDRPEITPRALDLDKAMTKALEARPEVISARKDFENRKLDTRVAKKGLRHGLDFEAGVTPAGNNLVDIADPDGIPNSGDEYAVTGGAGESFSEIPKFRNYDWSVGLTYTYPIGNRAAKSRYAIAKLGEEKAQLGIQSLEETIRVDVRTAVRNVESGVKRVQAAESSTVLQKKKLEAEQKKYENGISTSFEVLTFQNDLANAQLGEIRAKLDYVKSLAELERAQGTLLEARGLKLEE